MTLVCPDKFSEQPCRSCPISRKDLNEEEEESSTNFSPPLKASCAEVRSQLYVALDVGYLEEQKFHTLLRQPRKSRGLSVDSEHR